MTSADIPDPETAETDELASDALDPDVPDLDPDAFEPEAPAHLDPDPEEIVHVSDVDAEALADEDEAPRD